MYKQDSIQRQPAKPPRYQAQVLDSIHDAIIAVDDQHIITSWNQAAERLYGWKASSVVGRKISDLLQTKYFHSNNASAKEILREYGEWQGKVIQKHQNGSDIYILSSVSWIKDAAGARLGMVAVNRDITRQEKVENELRESEQRLERIMRATTDAIWDWDLLTDSVWWNNGLKDLFGYNFNEETATGAWWMSCIHPDDQVWVGEALHDLLNGDGTFWCEEYQFKQADGTFTWVLDKRYVERDEHGQAYRMTGGMVDISERKQAETLAKKNEELFAKAFNLSPAYQLLIRRHDGVILQVNDSLATTLGYTRQEMIGKKASSLNIVEQEKVNLKKHVIDHEGKLLNYEMQYRTASGEFRDVLINKQEVEVSGEQCILIISIDITERKKAEVKMQESEERFSKAFQENPVAQLIIRQRDDYILEVNTSLLKLVGYTRDGLVGKVISDVDILSREDLANRKSTLAAEGLISGLQQKYRTATGKYRDVLSSVQIVELNGEVCYLITSVDITERKRVEDALRKSEERFSKVFMTSPAPMNIIRKKDRTVLEVNNSLLKLSGYSRDEWIGRNVALWDFTTETDRDRVRQELVTQQNRVNNMEVSIFTPSGDQLYVLFFVEPIELDGEECFLTIAIDNTDRIKAEQALRKSEESFSKIFAKNATAQYIVRVEDQKILMVNDSFVELTGYSPEKIVGKQTITLPLLTPEERAKIREEFLANNRSIRNLELTLRRLDGSFREVLYSLDQYELNSEQCLIGVLVDNTERNQAQRKVSLLNEELIKREKRFRGLVENSKDLFIVSVPSEIKYISSNIEQILGFTPEEYRQLPIEQRVHPDDLPIRWEDLQSPGNISQLRFRSLHKHGGWRWLEGTVMNLFHIQEVGGILFTLRDITEKKQAEDALRESKAYLLQLTESLPQQVWTTRVDGFCDYLSKQFVEYTGVPLEKLLGNGWAKQLHPDDRDEIFTAWMYAVKTNTDFRREFRIRRHDGIYRWFDAIATRIYNSKGELIQWLGTNTDIDDKKRIEVENKRVNAELDKFVYSASHDLRSPLTGIMGLLSIIYDHDLTSPVLEYIQLMQTNVEKLDIILQGILEYSYNSRFAVKAERIDIHQLVLQCLDNLEAMPAFNKVEKQVEIQHDCDLLSDRYRLGLIIKALLKNAIQFADSQKTQSFVHVHIQCDKELVISVRDNGIGMKEEILPKIFEMFYRGSIQSQGSGLGLYIAQEVVTKLSGKISIDTKIGQGTTFTVVLPPVKETSN
uniref:histidine kinase n=1 Tax=Roseihalotalea indica TaxID=2867963 RepID=A0AA49GQ13_9BACT|nr:PAS domain-containing sensor histidine kinase [Tunicatimonas sp. TK19036]